MNRTLKKILAMLLCCASALSLAACGSSSSSGSAGSSGNTQASPTADNIQAAVTAAPDPEVAAENTELVYTPEFITVAEGTSSVLSAVAYADGGIYAVGDEVLGRRAPDDVEDEYVGQYDIRETRLFYVSNDGACEKLAGYAPLPKKDAPEGVYEFSSSSAIGSASVKPDGGLIVFETLYSTWSDIENFSWEADDAYKHYFYEQESWLRELDGTGKEVRKVKLDSEPTDSLYSDCVLDDEGNVLVAKAIETGSYSLSAVSMDGQVVWEIPSEEMINNVFRMADGTLYANVYGASVEMKKIDLASKSFGESTSLPGDAYFVYPGGGDYPLYYTSGSWLFGLDPVTGEKEKVLNWIDCDINPDMAYNVHVDSDGSIRSLLFEYDRSAMTYDVSLASISKKPVNSSEKTELVLATQGLSYEMREAVVSFNRHSKTAHISVKDYSEYNTEEDYTAGLTKLTTEVVAGSCPDLLDLNGLPLETLAAKGLLEDLYPYLDADAELSRDLYYENVLGAAEVNGGLYSTVSSFCLNTVAGATALVGERSSWTYDELNLALRDMPEGCDVFNVSATRRDILQECLRFDLPLFIDRETGETSFNTPEFISLLEFAGSFPDSYDWELYDSVSDSAIARIAEGRQMLAPMVIDSVNSLMYIDACFNDQPVTFIGYPTLNGTGSYIAPTVGLAMSTACTDKEAAWSFLRTFFTEKYAKNNQYSDMLPVLKSVLEAQLQEVTTVKYERDDSGKYRLDEKGEKIPQMRYYFADNEVHTASALSQATADAFRALLETTVKGASRDGNVIGIVLEQAEPFFAGQKPAEEVAKLVQSKAGIYINEQR